MIALTIKAKAEANVRAFMRSIDEPEEDRFTEQSKRSIGEWMEDARLRKRMLRARAGAIGLDEKSGGAIVLVGGKGDGPKKYRRAVLSDRGERWSSAKEAAGELGVTIQSIRTSMYQRTHVKGRILWWEGEAQPTAVCPPKQRRVIRDDGREFESIAEAAGDHPGFTRAQLVSRLSWAIRAGNSYFGHVYRVASSTAKAVSQ